MYNMQFGDFPELLNAEYHLWNIKPNQADESILPEPY